MTRNEVLRVLKNGGEIEEVSRNHKSTFSLYDSEGRNLGSIQDRTFYKLNSLNVLEAGVYMHNDAKTYYTQYYFIKEKDFDKMTKKELATEIIDSKFFDGHVDRKEEECSNV